MFVCFSLFQYWFQNRRVKTRREDSKIKSVYQTNLSNQFGRPVRRAMPSERKQFLIQSPPDQWRQAQRMTYSALENHLEVPPRSRPIGADYNFSSFKSNQLRGRSSLQVPTFHPAQFKRRPAEPARLSYRGSLYRYQPY